MRLRVDIYRMKKGSTGLGADSSFQMVPMADAVIESRTESEGCLLVLARYK